MFLELCVASWDPECMREREQSLEVKMYESMAFLVGLECYNIQGEKLNLKQDKQGTYKI